MKKIIYSIVAALILSIILALIFPTWFLNEDARWTYLNDLARIDVAIGGNVKNGRVHAEGANTRISQPKWLSNGNFQGTMVELPVSYRKRSYQITLTSLADASSQDATFAINFLGNIFQYKGQRMPAWVTFRNLTLNGKLIAAEKIVWHNQPFHLRHPFHPPKSITLAFDVQKPFTASDLSITRIVALFVALLLLSLFLSPLKRATAHVLIFTNRKDPVKMVSDGYRNIDPVYRRSFWIILGVLCFAFGFHTICYMWGNHDWSFLNSERRVLGQEGTGRYMKYSFKVLLSSGVYLPLIYDLITFVILALNAVLLCRYWCLGKRVIHYVLCGLVLVAQPFTLSMMYFVDMTPEVFIGVTCVLVALTLSEGATITREMSLFKKSAKFLISIALINFALAVYPVLINTIAVVLIGKLLVQSLDWDGTWEKLKSHMRMFVISVINVALGITSYKLVITYVFPMDLGNYNTRSLPLNQVPERLGVLLKQCFHQLYEYNMPFLSQWTLWVFSGFTIVLALYICSTDSLKQKAVRLSLLFGSLFATQTAMVISERHFVIGRIELFGLVFFEVLVMTIVITKLGQCLHNLWVIIGSSVVFVSILGDLDCLRVWKLGFDAEQMLWNRILARLETEKGFEIGGKYDVVLIGYHISLRPRYYIRTEKQTGVLAAQGLLAFAFDPAHAPFDAHQFYYPASFLSKKQYSSIHHAREPEYIKCMNRLYQAGVLQKAEVWSKPNGLIVWKDIILFVADGKELERCKKQFEREGGKK